MGTLAVLTATLLIRWSILKSIHEEIVAKFKSDEPIFFQRNSFCLTVGQTKEFNIITFPAACLLFLIFTLTTKRRAFQRGKWFNGYVGIPIPLDFFAHVKRTFAAMVFAVFADELLEIALDLFLSLVTPSDDGRFPSHIFSAHLPAWDY